MRVGLLTPSIGSFGQRGFYNTQETGLARALDKLVDETIVYKLISMEQEPSEELIEGCQHAMLKLVPAKSWGTNGLIDVKVLDGTLDAMVFFSDTQLCVPGVWRWAKKNGVKLFPYIGVLESHSVNPGKKALMNFLSRRNMRVYRKSPCFAKTPEVERQLRNKGVRDCALVPVGLDLTSLYKDYESTDRVGLKMKYGFGAEDRVILFVGRLTEEKQPLGMIRLFACLYGQNKGYRLLMVGTGDLKKDAEQEIEKLGISGAVKMLDRVPNSEIWQLYRLSECFVNLNRQEIFGMAILEAMYYDCKVVAWHAPGPDFIIEDGVSGYLVDNEPSAVAVIQQKEIEPGLAHARIAEHFTWETAANQMMDVMQRY
ncbi:MAG: glycosyltransferase [Lachnospiraceae bacterium]|nr:glycosyltransferase [Lachnospiraceae bacterium]